MNQLHWKCAAGRITLLPERGRVLQVTVAGQDAFWVNPSWTGDWNPGGDRLWLGPEVAWFWKTLKKLDFTQYEMPAAMDPGHWKLIDCGPGYCQMRQRVRLQHRHRRQSMTVEVTRRFAVVESVAATHFQKWIAYETTNQLRVVNGPVDWPTDLWSIIQVLPGGEMLISTRGAPVFRDYFLPTPRRLWQREQTRLRLQITGAHQYKVGVAPELVTGTVAYARPVARGHLVVQRSFFPQPWRAYCDVPIANRQSQGDAVQVYNDGGDFGGFGELEYHSPALIKGRGNDVLVDTNLTVVGLVGARDWARWRRHWR